MPIYTRTPTAQFLAGGGTASWNNASNILTGSYPGTYTEVVIPPGGGTSNQIHCTYNFTAIPASEAIVGIEFIIELECDNENNCSDQYVKLDNTGGAIGDSKVASIYIVGAPAGTSRFFTYGSPTDLWGLSAGEIASIKTDTDFGVGWAGLAGGQDQIRNFGMTIKVYTQGGKHVKRSDS